MTRERPRALRETIVLIVGALTSLTLVAAALLLVGDPEDAGRAEIARSTARAADVVASAWRRALHDPSLIAESMGPPLGWKDGEPIALQRRERLQLVPPAATTAASALLAESERLERRAGSPGEALDAALEALQKDPDDATRALLRLRAIQLGARAGRDDVVREQARAARAEIPANAFHEDTPLLLACVLAAARVLGADETCAILRELMDGADDAALQLPGTGAQLARRDDARAGAPVWRIEVDPVTSAWRDLIDGACAAPLASTWERLDTQAVLESVAKLGTGTLPERPDDGAWHVAPFATEDLLAWRAADAGRVTALIVSREAIESSLVRHVTGNGLLEDGFELALEGSARAGELTGSRAEPRSTLLGEPVPLEGTALSFQLFHASPASLKRGAVQRATWSRLGMLALAALSLLATVATFRALRRERRLAELKSTFVANVSHELRTPLASILLLSENLSAGRVTTPEAMQRYHGLIRREALRLRRLVEDVLDFSRLERGKRFEARLEDVGTLEWAKELELELAAWAESHGVEVRVETGELPRAVSFDGEALRRAVFNLVDNAIRHGGSKLATVTIDAPEAARLRIAVLDRGKGIPARDRERVFEPFTRLEEGHGGSAGTGLGLAIVREIAEAHGGRVIVRDPEEGTGTVFELTIPIERAAGAEDAA